MTSARRRRKRSPARIRESGAPPLWRRGYGRSLGAGPEKAGPGAGSGSLPGSVTVPKENTSRREFLAVVTAILRLGQKLNQGRPRYEKKLLQN